ncbi:MAG: branched-chain amino acid ABC transporter permease [Clostridiales bacterium]|jgi:branched-chain amino acid transport system permease protein|nr:branched-chain amino acid ABC transporter permease [Clostridiales bacterium]
MSTVVNIVIYGIIMGGVYGLISMGLTLQYGVGKILNVSHGEFLMLSAMTSCVLVKAGVHPLLTFVICLPAAFIVGFILNMTLYRWLRNFSKDEATFESNAMLMSFGLYFILANIGLKIWGTLSKSYQFYSYPVKILGATIIVNRLIGLGIAIVFIIAFFIFLNKTRLGKAIRATSQSTTAAAMMGVRINKTMAICFGTGGLLAAAAGILIGMSFSPTAQIGLTNTVIALIVVVLGGMGSIPGAVLGGLLIGLVGQAVSFFDTSLVTVAYYLMIIILLLIRPKGLLGR